MNTRRALLFLVVLLLAAVPAAAQVNTGSADITRYVAMGDSLTAGFASGGLSLDSQQTSYPALIFTQVNGSSAGFEQPLVSNPGIPARLHLASLVPVVISQMGGSGVPVNLSLPRPYDNLGVPGADANDLLNTVTDGGGMHDLILRGLGTQLMQGLSLQPTFVTLWIGNNDALGAALSGMVIDGVTLTRAADFEARLRTAVSTIAGTGAQLAIATLPSVTAIPYVTTLPPVLVDPVTGSPVLVGQPVPLIGPDGLLAANDFVLLTAKDELAVGKGIPVSLGGSGEPLSDSVVLSASEAATIVARQAQFNDAVRAVAREFDAALADMDQLFADIANHGYNLGGVEFTQELLTGGLFSFDGVHPTKLGYAIAANHFLQAINREYSARIPLVNLRPFVEGGAIAGITAADLAAVGFSSRLRDRLLDSLGYPSMRRLEKMKKRRGGSGPSGPSAPGGRPGHDGDRIR